MMADIGLARAIAGSMDKAVNISRQNLKHEMDFAVICFPLNKGE